MLPTADIEETCGPRLVLRVADELTSAMRRRPTEESRLAGALQSLIPLSERLAAAACAGLDVLIRRGHVERPLYAAMARGLVERKDGRIAAPLLRVLERDDGGGLGTLGAVALCDETCLAEPLMRLAGVRSTHLGFAAELARVRRGESAGKSLASMALRLKESHRIELFSQVLLPMVRSGRRLDGCREAFRILRDPERHLGRWLCLAEGAQLAGDVDVQAQAGAQASSGAASAKAAWSLLAWALGPKIASCTARPNLELVARLSDRPSAERELSFLFRMADAGQVGAKAMLCGLVRQSRFDTEAPIRAAYYLIRDHGQKELVHRLLEVAKSASREGVRGLALAVLCDLDPETLEGVSLELGRSRALQTAVWSALVRRHLVVSSRERLVTESRLRRLQFGWAD